MEGLEINIVYVLRATQVSKKNKMKKLLLINKIVFL